MTRVLRVVKWEEYQHYKDRNPVWVKIYTELLDRPSWLSLSDIARAQIVGCWMLAAKRGNALPVSPATLRVLIGSNAPVRLKELIEGGWLEYSDAPARTEDRSGWASRHVAAELRAELLAAANHQCAWCKSTERLEIDHIIPISRGGNGDRSNLQVLCRRCNRSKRTRTSAEHLATQGVAESEQDSSPSRASAPSREEEGEEERETSLLLLPAREGATSPPIALTVAANQAITRKWGESPNPLLAQHAKTHELAAFVAAEGIPVPFAQRSIARQVLAKNDGPPRTMAYFRAGILDDWRGHQAAQEAAASPLITPLELAAVRRGASVADTSRDSAYRAAVELQRIAQDRSA